MDYDFEDIMTVDQVSEDFAFDSGESFNSDLTIEEIDTPIKDLKVIILSIDWEITPDILDKYQQEIKNLEKLWSKDNIALAFLRILGALGIYIKTCQAKAHPDAVKLLYSVYNGLEKIIISSEMSNADKVALVQSELQKYNAIRDIIKQANASPAKESTVSASIEEAPHGQLTAPTPHTQKPVTSTLATTKEPAVDPEDEEIIPALSSASRLVTNSTRQWSFKETEQDSAVAGRLTDFFGEDDSVDTESTEGVVPLATSIDKTPLPADHEPDKQSEPLVDTESFPVNQEEETSQRLDSFFGDEEPTATEPQIEDNDGVVPLPGESPQEETESSSSDKVNIFDDLFSNKPSTPADDLLLKMHLPIDKKGKSSEQESEKNSKIESDSESLTLTDKPENATISTSQAEEISSRLDSFFGDDEPTSTGSVFEVDDGVVPLPSSYSEPQCPDYEQDVSFVTAGHDGTLTAIAQLKEILAGLGPSLSSEENVAFAAAIKKACEQLTDNTVALMLLEALDSSFVGLREITISQVDIERLNALCDIIAEVLATPTLLDSRVTVAICDEMRKYITFLDTKIFPVLNKQREND